MKILPLKNIAASRSSLFRSDGMQRVMAFGALILLFIGFSIASPYFLTFDNIVGILLATAVNGILALGVTFVIITAGIDLSVGTVMTFSAVMTGVFITFWGWPIPLGILGGMLAGALAGFINGTLISRMKIPPFIATLGMLYVTKGFVNRIKEKYPNITIVDVQYGGGDHLKTADLAKAMIQANPNIKGFFGANEGSAIGVLLAVKELGMEGKIVVIGYDSGKDQIDAIKAGTMAGAITQDPIGIGYKCVEAAVKATKGETLPKFIDTGFHWYDKTNIDDPTIAPLLYQ